MAADAGERIAHPLHGVELMRIVAMQELAQQVLDRQASEPNSLRIFAPDANLMPVAHFALREH